MYSPFKGLRVLLGYLPTMITYVVLLQHEDWPGHFLSNAPGDGGTGKVVFPLVSDQG